MLRLDIFIFFWSPVPILSTEDIDVHLGGDILFLKTIKFKWGKEYRTAKTSYHCYQMSQEESMTCPVSLGKHVV